MMFGWIWSANHRWSTCSGCVCFLFVRNPLRFLVIEVFNSMYSVDMWRFGCHHALHGTRQHVYCQKLVGCVTVAATRRPWVRVYDECSVFFGMRVYEQRSTEEEECKNSQQTGCNYLDSLSHRDSQT